MKGILTDIRFMVFPVLTKKPPARFLHGRFKPNTQIYPSMALFVAAIVELSPAFIWVFIMSSMPGMLGIPAGTRVASICRVSFVPSPSGSRM